MKQIIIGSILLLSFSALKAEEVSTINLDHEVPAPEQVLSSAGNRKNLKHQVNFNLMGGEHSTTAIGVSAARYLTSQDMLLLRYSNFNGNDSDIKKLSAVTLGYRRFEGNSFNLMPTIFFSKITSSYTTYSSLFNYSKKDYTRNQLGIGFRIGNEWQWKHFTLGVDWVGLNRAIKTFNDKKPANAFGDDINDYSLTLLSLYVGYSF